MRRGLPRKFPVAGVARTVVVASGKGGVGKSTTAVNLALALAQSEGDERVGILDADIYGPSIPIMMKRHDEPRVNKQNLIVPHVQYGVKCMSMGFLVDASKPIVWRGLMIMSGIQKLLRGVAWGPLDYLIVDMPPGTGDTQLSIAQSIPVDGAVIVTTPQDVALVDARKGAAMFQQTGVPVLGLVQNMSRFVCPGCGRESHIFGRGGAARLAAEMNVDLIGDVPIDPAIQETSDAGLPIVYSQPQSEQASIYREIARKVVEKLKSAPPSALR